ncbi:MAG: hypothetical protein KC445_14200, partial [Anaerolineales bacterium]|nr:hypothetical protein [Anaerolineales bacterium]
LDFGDYNPNGATEHNVSLVAYDSNGQVVSTDTLSFTSDGVLVRNEGLWITGDASASVGQPGNYYFVVEGAGIVRAELQFSSDLGTGPSDPNFGFSVLCFQPEPDTPPPPPTGTPLTCEDIGQQTLAVDTWNESVSSSLAPVSLSFTPPAGADYALVNTGWEWTGDVNQAQVTQMHTVETPFGSTTSGDYGNGELAGQVFWYDVLQGAYDQPSMPITISYAGNGSDSGSNQSHGLISWCGTPPPPPQLDPPTADLTLLLVKPAPIIGGKYLVEYACSATAPNLVSATINGYDMINGQQIRLIVSDTPSVRYWYNEVLAIYAPEFSFDVTCADDLGNEVSTQVIPEFIIP